VEVTAPASGEKLVPIELVGGAHLRGRVVDRAGAPIPYVWACLGKPGTASERTDLDGRFELTWLAPGRYAPRVGCRGGTTDLAPAAGASFAPVDIVAHRTTEVELRVAGTLGEIRGRLVRDDGGSLVAEVCVDLVCTMTTSSGRFVIGGVLPGAHELRVTSLDGAVGAERDVTAGADVVVRIQRTGALDLTALDGPGNCYIELTPRSDWGRYERVRFDERHLFADLAPGTFQLRVACGYGAVDGEATVTVVSGQTTRVAVPVAPSD
jgi:hypothetical protein